MKKFFSLLFLLCLMSFSAHSQWSLQTNPLGTSSGNSLGKIQFVSQTEGWIACGSNGSLLHTTNGGTTWDIVTFFPGDVVGNMSDPALSLCFVNPSHGWALKTYANIESDDFSASNGAVLYQTTNSGSSWTKKNFPKLFETITYNSSDLQGIWQWHSLVAANSNQLSTWGGWMHGLMTFDGNGNGSFSSGVKSDGSNIGISSVSMTISSQGKISFGGDSHGFMSSDKNTVYMTVTDGGGGFTLGVMEKKATGVTYSNTDMQGTWQMHSLTTANPSSSTPNANWMHGTVTIDANGNAVANVIDMNGPKSTKNSVLSISADGIVSNSPSDFHGFMSADKKTITISMTEGGGYNLMIMQKVISGTSYGLADLQGRWQTHVLSTTNTSVSILNQKSSWSYGVISVKANGLASMNFTDSNGNSNTNEDSLIISSNGVITITNNNIYGTMSADKKSIILTKSDENGSLTVAVMQKDLSVSGDFGMQVQFATENIGWVSVYNMLYGGFKIYKTTNGGTDWNEITGPTNPVGGIYNYMDATNGWLIGSNNVTEGGLNSIFHTTDGGMSWVLQASNIGNANAICFSDLLHGWVVGKNGLVYKTINGGINWTTVSNIGLSTNSNSKTVFFLDANNGWIGNHIDGTNAISIYGTKDGGSTWTIQSTPAQYDIFSICFWDANHGWFTSDQGQIAHFIQSNINVSAGGLAGAFSQADMNSITKLTLTGTIDARDFKTMRDNMPALAVVDLSGTTILEYNGTEGTYSTDITDYPANTIPRLGFYNKKSLTSAILPTTITALGRSSFNSCSGLTSINIPSSVTSIGYAEFNGCSSLASVNIPSGVTLIDTWTFGNCTSLKSIIIPSSVVSLGSSAFMYSGLTNIELPTGLHTVGQYAFQNCSALTSVVIPSTVTSVGYCAFTFDNALAKFVVASDNSKYSSLDGVLFDKTQQKLISYPAAHNSVYQIPVGVNVVDTAAFEGSWVMHSVVIPSTVTTLSKEAFYWCQNLKTIDIPASITSIGGYTFYYCLGLTSITLHSSPVDLSASDSVFKYIDKSACVLYVPIGTKTAYQAATQWKDFNNIVELASKTVNISAGGLYATLTPTELSITTNLKITGTIDARDFKTMRDNMPVLTNLDISGANITAYSGTEGTFTTTNSYPPNTIPIYAFYFNSPNQGKISLKTVNLPTSLTSIGVSAFSQCGLTDISLPNGITTVDDYAFVGCQALNSVFIPTSLSSIGIFSFAWLGALPYFQVSADNPYFSTIDGVLFNKNQTTLICYPLGKIGTNYQIPSSVTVIDKSAFVGTYIPGWSLEQVFIPPTVTTLSTFAFYECENFKSFEIPSSVTSIGSSAFYNCKGLTSITVHSANPIDLSSSSDVFLNVDKVACTLYVPTGSKSAYQSANQWKDFVNIVDVATDVPAVDYTNIKLYPNPIIDVFYVSGIEGIVSLTLFDINGRLLLTTKVTNNSSISVSTLQKGVYIAKIITIEGTIVKKLIKK